MLIRASGGGIGGYTHKSIWIWNLQIKPASLLLCDGVDQFLNDLWLNYSSGCVCVIFDYMDKRQKRGGARIIASNFIYNFGV